MPEKFSIETYLEKNRLASDVAFLVCLEVTLLNESGADSGERIYVVNNNEDIDFNGKTYAAYPFDLALESKSGEEVTLSLSIMDVTGTIKQKMALYRGVIGSPVKVIVVNSALIAGDPEIAIDFRVMTADTSDFSIRWTLGSRNHLAYRFPRRIQMKDRCSWQYKSARCGYTGTLPTCDYTFQGTNGCEIHNNTKNYGGFPGINQ